MQMPIPGIIFQTSPEPAPDYIRKIFRETSPRWSYRHFTDADILDYFQKYPISEFPRIREVFYSFKRGEHRADLFRYYYLYLNGGIFVDSDAAPMVNLDCIVGEYSHIFVYPFDSSTGIYNGVIAAPPRSKIIYEALTHCYHTNPEILENSYHYFCKTLRTLISIHSPPDSAFYQEVNMVEEGVGGSIIRTSDNKDIFIHYWKLGFVPEEAFKASYNTSIDHLDRKRASALDVLRVTIKDKLPRLIPLVRRAKILLGHKTLGSYSWKFSQVYKHSSWGTGSGSGSTEKNTLYYNSYISDFIVRTGVTKITDIGCGDWQSSHLIYDSLLHIDYLGIDCVEQVISSNKQRHPSFSFQLLDAVQYPSLVRDSELYIIKDVLQHLRTKDIYRLLDALTSKHYRYIVIVNYSGQRRDNEDLPFKDDVAHSRGLKAELLPLKNYKAIPLVNYDGGEDKEISVIFKRTAWNNYVPGETWAFSPDQIQLTDVSSGLSRVGPKSDGGYVVFSGLTYDLFISCGIARDIRFEEEFLDQNPGLCCLAYDGTIHEFPSTEKPINWFPKNIAAYPSNSESDLSDVLDGFSNVFLKMDIEGSEFDWINNIGTNILEKFSQIVIEIHWPFDVYRARALKKLSQTHSLIHIHGNNYNDCVIPSHLPSGRSTSGTINLINAEGQNIEFPEVFEATFLRKDLLPEGCVPISKTFPTELDFPNCPSIPDIPFRI